MFTKKLYKKSSLLIIALCFTFILCSCSSSDDSKLTSDKETTKHDIVVIGGGISGLTASYYLRNKDVVLLEKNDTVGGRTQSGTEKGFSYARGTEYLGKPEGSLKQMIDELGLKPKEIPSPMDGYFDGSNFYYGSDGEKRYLINNSSPDAFTKFTDIINKEYDEYDEVPDLDYNKNAKKLDDMSAEEWLKENNIPDVFIKKYNVASRGLFGANLNEISALSLIPEAAFDYEGDTKEDLDAHTYKKYSKEDIKEEYEDAKEEPSESYTFEKGISELTNKIASVLGDKVKLNSCVEKVEKYNDGYKVKYTDKNKKEQVIIADKVILALPAPIASKIASSVISKEKLDIMNNVKYSSYATVALFSKTPIFNKAFDLAVPDNYFFTDIYDSTWVERAYNKDLKDKKDYIASAYIAPKTATDHSLDTMSDEEIMKKLYTDLDKVFPNASSKVTGYSIERFPYAYPVMSKGAYKRLIKLDDLNHGSLILAGDYTIYPTFEAAVQSGFIASKRVLDSDN